MHSRWLRRVEAQPGRDRRVYNVNRQHATNGVIDAASVGGVAPQQILTGFVMMAAATTNAFSEALGVTTAALTGPLAAFPALDAPSAVYSTGNQQGQVAHSAIHALTGALPRLNFALLNPQGFLTLVQDGSTFIGKSATATLRARSADEIEQLRPPTIARPRPDAGPPPVTAKRGRPTYRPPPHNPKPGPPPRYSWLAGWQKMGQEVPAGKPII